MERISWPNRITITRLVLIAPFVMSLLHLQDEYWGEIARYAALVLFVLMAISDGLDGYLARKLHQESAIGRFLDPTADMLLIISSVSLLAHEGTHVDGVLLPSTVAVIVIGKEIIQIVGFCIVYIETSRVYLDPERLGKWCMGVLMGMIIAILLSPDMPSFMWWLPRFAWWLAALLATISVVQYFQLARRFIANHAAQEDNQ
jgi:CDP-diacylglycerol--glycerol-3-phosphate 3-phosphatidyltransferase